MAMRVVLVGLNIFTQLLVIGGLVISANTMNISWFTGAAIVAGLTMIGAIVLIKPERMH